jgi:hypothetical protein
MKWMVYFDARYLPPFPLSSSPIERRIKCFPIIKARGKELAEELKQAFPGVTIVEVFDGTLGCAIEISEEDETTVEEILKRFDSEVLPAETI